MPRDQWSIGKSWTLLALIASRNRCDVSASSSPGGVAHRSLKRFGPGSVRTPTGQALIVANTNGSLQAFTIKRR